MGLEDKLVYLAFGGLIGFVLGYFARGLQDLRDKVTKVEKKVDHVEEAVTGDEPDSSKWEQRSDAGFMRYPYIADIMVIMVVALSVWASFQTAHVNNELKQTLNCLTKYNAKEGAALGGRDNAVTQGTQSEIKLWTEYGALYALAKRDPSKIPEAQDKLNEAIAAHRNDLIDTQVARDANPYPNPDIIQACKE